MADEITDAQRELVEYIHSLKDHFQVIDESHLQGIVSYKGDFLVATFHQTSIEDIADDKWSLIIEDIDFVGVSNASDETLCGDQVLAISPFEDEDEEY